MSPQPEPSPIDRTQEIVNAVWLNFFGLLCVGSGWYIHHKENYERNHFKEVRAKVVDSVQRRKDKSLTDYEYAPVVEFTDNGKPIRFNRIPHESYRRSTGTEVIVRYDPQSPEASAYILDPLNGLFFWIPFVLAGISFSGGLNALWKLFRSTTRSGA